MSPPLIMGKSETTEFLNYLKYIRRYSPHTITAYKTDLKQFKKYKGSKILTADKKDVTDFISFLKSNSISKRSIRRKIEVLKSYYYFNIKNSRIKLSPCRFIPRIQFDKTDIGYIKQEDLTRILDSLDPGINRKKIRDKLVLELLYLTACRADEIINLKKKDIDYSQMCIKVLGKGKKERIIPITPQIISLIKSHLSKWKSKNRSSFLLNDNKGKKLYPMFLWRIIRKYFTPEDIGMNTSAHIIRHSTATHLYNNGATIYDIQKLLGHGSIISTAGYIHLEPEILLNFYLKAFSRRSD
jgi:integrase/recombinase XerC